MNYSFLRTSRSFRSHFRYVYSLVILWQIQRLHRSLFSRRDTDGSIILVGVYVDDIIVAHNNKKFDWFKSELTGPNGFKSRYIGKLTWFLGISIDQHDDYSVHVNQDQYIDKLIEKFIPNFRSGSIKHSMPCNPATFLKLSVASSTSEQRSMENKPYLQLIGSLLYLSTMTRPDLCYYMSVLCSFMHNPSLACYNAALDLLQFVANTKDNKLHFTGKFDIPDGINSKWHDHIRKNFGMLAYSDASWREVGEDGFNMFGYVIYFMGGPISFCSKQIKVIALSSAEAEYAAAAYTCKEISFVRNIIKDLGVQLSGATVISVDNQAAIKICKNSGVTGRNKHFKDSIHYFRHSYKYGMIYPLFVSTRHQRADGMTKPLGKTDFRRWTEQFNFTVTE